jgi:hypothetical protein
MLIEHGADINAPISDVDKTGGQTILFDYARYANFDKVYWLLERGAKPIAYLQFDPPAPKMTLYQAINSIYWYPVDIEKGEIDWQRKCQIWLLQHGYPRPPMPENYRELRQKFGYPTDEKDIPLPELPASAPQGKSMRQRAQTRHNRSGR